MGYSQFEIGGVIVEYGLFNTTSLIRNLICIRFGIVLSFDTVLYQFLETGTSDIDVFMYRSTPEILRFHPIPLFIFPFSPLNPIKAGGLNL